VSNFLELLNNKTAHFTNIR